MTNGLTRFGRFPLLFAVLAAVTAGVAQAHHSSQAEFGDWGSATTYVEGRIVRINWTNPHISMDIEITGGALPAGEKWRLVTHPVQIQLAYGFAKEEFAVGDTLRMLAWTHLRGQPLIWPRAIQVNDGPLKSNLRYTDMIDITKGVFESMNIVPAANLNGSSPVRTGPEITQKLRDMGLLDGDGNMIWPPPAD